MNLLRKSLAEGIGTYLLVFFGCGSVHTAVLMGAQVGLWQVAVVWGIGVTLAIYATAAISGAHINPAITIALALRGRCSFGLVVPYVVSQVAGAFLAAATLYFLFSPQLAAKELEKGVERGKPGSIVTAMCYGEYYPNPGTLAAGAEPYSERADTELSRSVSQRTAIVAEILGTLILALVVFAVTDPRNASSPGAMAPVMIGLAVAALISVIAPLTQGCFNPARDFGPRLFAYLAGWGNVAIPGQHANQYLYAYIIAPVLGASLGGHLYDWVLRPSKKS